MEQSCTKFLYMHIDIGNLGQVFILYYTWIYAYIHVPSVTQEYNIWY